MKILRNITVIILLFAFTGCAPVAFLGGAILGVSGYKYYDGALDVIYQAPYQKTFDAAAKALEALNYSIAEKVQKITEGSITTTGPVKTRIKVSIEYVSAEETKVKIRVGLLGDESASNKIKDKISDIVFDRTR